MSDLTTWRFGEVTENFDSRRRPVKSGDRVSGRFPYYGASGVVDYVDDYIFDGEYLLVAEDGENLRSRSTPVAFLAEGQFWVNNHAHVVRGNRNADTRFLAHLLSITDIAGYLSGSAQPKLSRSAMDSIRLELPPIREQRAIAGVLGALDDKIAANIKLAVAIEDVLQAEASLKWLDAYSSDWLPITDILDLNPSTAKPVEAEPAYIDMKKLPERGSGISGWERREAKGGTRFMQGDTLMARITPCLENRKTGFVDLLAPGQIGIGSTEFIALRSKEPYAKPLTYFIATHPAFRDFAIRHMVGTSGRQRVSARDLASYTVPAPDHEWVKEFGTRATEQFEYTKSLRGENRTLAATRNALLPHLMSGKLRVKDAERVMEDIV